VTVSDTAAPGAAGKVKQRSAALSVLSNSTLILLKVIALVVAGVIVGTGVRLLAQASPVLVDESLPAREVEVIRKAIDDFASRGVVGYHERRT
jgi:divalent metal cation (Fe/Co/Zn/Cd) transporter